MNRGDRRELSFQDDADRQRFLETRGEVSASTIRWFTNCPSPVLFINLWISETPSFYTRSDGGMMAFPVVKVAKEMGSHSHFAVRGCGRSASRSAWKRLTAWSGADALRLIGRTQTNAGAEPSAAAGSETWPALRIGHRQSEGQELLAGSSIHQRRAHALSRRCDEQFLSELAHSLSQEIESFGDVRDFKRP